MEKSINLFFTEGASDKVYQAQISQSEGVWKVTFQYGRRGGPLKDGTKYEGPDYSAALKVYDKLVKSKTSKGYTEEESGAVFTSAEHAGRVTGFRPMLLNPIEPAEVARLDHEDWWVLEKFDGERRGCNLTGDIPVYSNRRGLEVGIDAGVDEALKAIKAKIGPMNIDCEDLGGRIAVFDILSFPGLPAGCAFKARIGKLIELSDVVDVLGLREIVEIAPATRLDAFLKMGMAAQLEAQGAEGYVLRRGSSLYTPGRPASGGDALKVKFWVDMTCRVAEGRLGKRSVGLELLKDGSWVSVGNVTIPANAAIPAAGSFIDVQYLYAYSGSNALFQPTYMRVRNDIDPNDCTVERLKYKSAVAA